MIIVDTNVLSELMRTKPDAMVLDWFDRQPAATLWTTTITAFELRYGVARLSGGDRRAALQRAIDAMLEVDLRNRVLPFDAAAAERAATFAASMEMSGRTIDARDLFIAGIVASRGATLATRNVKHFVGLVQLTSPWSDAG